VVDRPQDQPEPDRPGEAAAARPATERTTAIGGREVLAYLRDHPNFLERYPEALRLLRPPSRQTAEGVVDFQYFMLERLRRDLARLQDEQNNLIATSRGNLASQCRVHKGVLAMLRAASFEQLLQTVTTDLTVLIDVDIITLGIESATAPYGVPARVARGAGATRLPVPGLHLLRAGTVETMLGPTREVLLCTDIRGDPALYGGGAGLVRSQALLRLSFGGAAPVGLLCIGTRNPDTFHPGLGTELLSFLARTLEIRVAQWLGRAP
jgi:uncharacterized protein YigA (DUF484 family)